MMIPKPITTTATRYTREGGTTLSADDILTSAWEYAGRKVQIFVNYHAQEKHFSVMGKDYALPARQAMLLPLED